MDKLKLLLAAKAQKPKPPVKKKVNDTREGNKKVVV